MYDQDAADHGPSDHMHLWHSKVTLHMTAVQLYNKVPVKYLHHPKFLRVYAINGPSSRIEITLDVKHPMWHAFRSSSYDSVTFRLLRCI